jgi:hypothetical protein
MRRDIQRRLQKLESQVPPPPTEQEKIVKSLHMFLFCAVAYYLGDPTPKGPPMEAYMRALDIRTRMNFEKPLMTKIQTFLRGIA